MDDAKAWIEANSTDKPPVFATGEIPPSVLRTLQRNNLVISVPGGIAVIRSPGDKTEDVLSAVLWSIVEKLTEIYRPAVVERDSAVRLHIGRTDPGPEIRIRQTTPTRWLKPLVGGISIRLERGTVADAVPIQVGEATIPVEAPERLLLSLPVSILRDSMHDVALWLKSLVLVRPAVILAYRENPRPVVLKRIEDIARDVGNTVLADLLADVISAEQKVRIGRDRTGVGRTLVIPGSIANLNTSRDPWLDRLRVMIRDSRDQIAPVLSDTAETRLPLADLLTQARERRSYDAYHSSSIEGYRLRMDEVSQLLGPESGQGNIEDLASRVAVVGYARAFDALLARIELADGRLSLSSQLILDLYTDLFAPSVEAGLVDRAGLRRYRNGPVYIRNSMYVPPNADKVPALMEVTIDEINAIPVQEGMLRGILTHLWFVWAHPFFDGNGRVARFLMNAAMLAARHPWLTIRVDQRVEYFRALRRAQIDEEYADFARFITDSTKHQEAH
jgi:hypothetical protein